MFSSPSYSDGQEEHEINDKKYEDEGREMDYEGWIRRASRSHWHLLTYVPTLEFHGDCNKVAKREKEEKEENENKVKEAKNKKESTTPSSSKKKKKDIRKPPLSLVAATKDDSRSNMAASFLSLSRAQLEAYELTKAPKLEFEKRKFEAQTAASATAKPEEKLGALAMAASVRDSQLPIPVAPETTQRYRQLPARRCLRALLVILEHGVPTDVCEEGIEASAAHAGSGSRNRSVRILRNQAVGTNWNISKRSSTLWEFVKKGLTIRETGHGVMEGGREISWGRGAGAGDIQRNVVRGQAQWESEFGAGVARGKGQGAKGREGDAMSGGKAVEEQVDAARPRRRCSTLVRKAAFEVKNMRNVFSDAPGHQKRIVRIGGF
ncbi:hypothetical protein BDK51DRAFT_29549 [Blyttiomyces helicus]|uniref:Uncharacterized protein n=1 Tax=Blyttiomyces helicus TaxID=388810 RepID=A0A4P9WJ44_9FUNG|nr:hypothetical protein BDK51DRAFT_29549 [Blyttiomyces helicus]|eukprot:RKO92931.1 hypothetical protein BDK51DRAFT_29549 [Blyttiomyces helicus]